MNGKTHSQFRNDQCVRSVTRRRSDGAGVMFFARRRVHLVALGCAVCFWLSPVVNRLQRAGIPIYRRSWRPRPWHSVTPR